MTYQRHWLLSWGGTLGDGADVWANNVRMINPETGSPDSLSDGAMESLLDGFVIDIRALFAIGNSFIPQSVSCTWVKFNEIDANGHYADPTKTHVRFLTGTGVIKGAIAGNVPTFQSVCVTTTTARQRGPASKGRLFVPQCAAPVASNGRISTANVTAMAGVYAQFLTNLGDEEGIDTHAIAPAVVSNVGVPGPAERITGVKVGDVPDVITRRKNALKEAYVSAAVSTS